MVYLVESHLIGYDLKTETISGVTKSYIYMADKWIEYTLIQAEDAYLDAQQRIG